MRGHQEVARELAKLPTLRRPTISWMVSRPGLGCSRKDPFSAATEYVYQCSRQGEGVGGRSELLVSQEPTSSRLPAPLLALLIAESWWLNIGRLLGLLGLLGESRE